MTRLVALLGSTAREHRAERQYQRAWDRAIARAGSDSHLDEINAIFGRCGGHAVPRCSQGS